MTLYHNLPDKLFHIVLADPPWSYYGQQDKWGAAEKFYRTRTDEEIMSFPMLKILGDPGILFMWATSPRLDFAMQCIKQWGLFYRGIAFVWVKTKQDGTPIGAQGVRPSIVKPTAEFVLAASRTEKGRPLQLWDESIRNVILAPKREHSEKPDAVHASIESMYPTADKIEIFARRQRSGWHCWGDEVPAETS